LYNFSKTYVLLFSIYDITINSENARSQRGKCFMNSTAIILAAGQGTRMKSKLPKVLHKVVGIPMLEHVLNSLDEAKIIRKIVVLGHEAEIVENSLGRKVEVVYQKEQLGTGHAVMQAKDLITASEDPVLVLCGDTPLLTAETLLKLMRQHHEKNAVITVLTSIINNPKGYGRIIRNEQGVKAIVEEKDASETEKIVQEINTGTYCFNGDFLLKSLDKLTTDNSQGEYYLTDLIKLAVQDNLKVEACVLENVKESLGINNRIQLAEAEKILRLRVLEQLMSSGVTIIDPQATYIDANVEIGQDTIIYPGTYLEGKTVVGSDCIIGPGTRVVDCRIGNGVQVQNTVIFESQIGNNCNIGPFAYLRPGTVLEDDVKVGDFVEIKKSKVGKGSKVPHLSYVGDAVLGDKVNVGCGSITCNYDGKAKHVTIIEDEAFIGSNTNLVAPVTIGKNAVIGAGSTITRDVPEGALGIGRPRQKNFPNWAKEKKD